MICCVWELPCGKSLRTQGKNVAECREVAVEAAGMETVLPVDLDYFERNEPSFKNALIVPGVNAPPEGEK